jgi:UrcA family protein
MNTVITRAQSAIAVAAMLGAGASGYAALSAAADPETRSTIVKYDDLNLANPQGAAALYRRIVAAAHQVCDAFDDQQRFPGLQADVKACLQQAISRAVTEIGSPELVSVYNANNREPLPLTFVAQTR